MYFLLAKYHVTPREFGELTWPQVLCVLRKGESKDGAPSATSPEAIKRRLAEFYGPKSRFGREREPAHPAKVN